MLHPRHILVTLLSASLALGGCKKEVERDDIDEEAELEAASIRSESETTERSDENPPNDEQTDEGGVATIEPVSPTEPVEPAGPVIEPILVQGHPYARTVEFRSKRETRVERGNQTIMGTTFTDWSIAYLLTANERTSKRDYLVDIAVTHVSATRDSEPWADGKLPDEGASYRCRLRQRALSCEGMPQAVEEFASHWLFGTWGDFVPSGVVTSGERWQRRGPYGARFGIEGDEPTSLSFEVTTIEELGNQQFRAHHDLLVESDVYWPTPGGQRRADISGSGEAEYDSILGLFSDIELGWDGMLVHEGRVGSVPFRFTRREESRVRIETSSPDGRPGSEPATRRNRVEIPARAPEGASRSNSPDGPVVPSVQPATQQEEDAVGSRPY